MARHRRAPSQKIYTFPDFARRSPSPTRSAQSRKKQGHHPDIYLAWGKVHVSIWTHKIDGLTRSDFVLAAKIDSL